MEGNFMIDQFEKFDFFEDKPNIEKLEKGIYIEHIFSDSNTKDMDTEDITFIFGETESENFWWHHCIQQAVEEGFLDSAENLILYDLMEYFKNHHYLMELTDDVSLENLIERLEEGEKLICFLNDLVLEVPQTADIPSISANRTARIKRIDLSEIGKEEVVIESYGCYCDDNINNIQKYPLQIFLKSWKTSRNRILSLQPVLEKE